VTGSVIVVAVGIAAALSDGLAVGLLDVAVGVFVDFEQPAAAKLRTARNANADVRRRPMPNLPPVDSGTNSDPSGTTGDQRHGIARSSARAQQTIS
jgi:hypothetical protein